LQQRRGTETIDKIPILGYFYLSRKGDRGCTEYSEFCKENDDDD